MGSRYARPPIIHFVNFYVDLLHIEKRKRARGRESQRFSSSVLRRCLAPQEKGARRWRSGICGLKPVEDLAQPNVALKDLCPAKISSSWKSAKVMMRLKSILVLFVFFALTQARQRGSRGSQPSKEETEKSDREGKCKSKILELLGNFSFLSF